MKKYKIGDIILVKSLQWNFGTEIHYVPVSMKIKSISRVNRRQPYTAIALEFRFHKQYSIHTDGTYGIREEDILNRIKLK